VFSGSSLTLSYTNFIVLRIYAEALDRLRVRLNMYLVAVSDPHSPLLSRVIVFNGLKTTSTHPQCALILF